jgi:xanthine dehydrogenase accessory factor
MPMSIEFYQTLSKTLHQRPIVLATIVETQGSVPREIGAKMMIDASGRTFGTIGGGAGEAKIIQQAQIVLQTGIKQQCKIDLSGNLQRPTEGICGGIMQVWLEPWQGDWAIALTQQILDHLKSGTSIQLITPTNADKRPYLAAIASPKPDNAWSEILHPPPWLLIVGAGHCGIELAKIANLIGFQIMVHDDRPEWANLDNYPQASVIATTELAPAIAPLANHPQLYAALLTRNYQHDLAALELLLNRQIPCLYIGMIGSERRVHQVKQMLIQSGTPPETLQHLHAPIGLPIGALTPAEIAVSISAELIQARRSLALSLCQVN